MDDVDRVVVAYDETFVDERVECGHPIDGHVGDGDPPAHPPAVVA